MNKGIVKQMKKKWNKLSGQKKTVLALAGLICVFAIGFSIVLLKNKDNIMTRMQTLNLQRRQEEIVITQGKNSFTKDIPGEVKLKFRTLLNINNQFVGWLRIEDTGIDYPVVRGKDYKKFGNQSFFGEKNKNGTLALDQHCALGLGVKEKYVKQPGMNQIIYGNNEKFAFMFGRLLEYQYEDYGSSHDIITFETLYEKREYKVLSVFFDETDPRDMDAFHFENCCFAKSEEEFLDFYKNIMERSLYKTSVNGEYGDEFITLTTPYKNGKFAVIAVRIL